MAKELKSAEMTREYMIDMLRDYCDRRSSCLGCPLKIDSGPWCNNSFRLMPNKKLEERMALLEDDDIRKSQCEIRLKKAEEQLGMEIHLDKDQQAKADYGKEELTLVPRRIIYDICAIRMYGNKKYPEGGPDNWKQVEIERYRNAAYRHFLAYLDDPQGKDEESGFPHLWHLACNIAFLCEMEDPE